MTPNYNNTSLLIHTVNEDGGSRYYITKPHTQILFGFKSIIFEGLNTDNDIKETYTVEIKNIVSITTINN